MRPRHKAAENVGRDPEHLPDPVDASMRPRHKAAENRSSSRLAATVPVCFNEAAA